ncbi:MAG TPA: hypothetical protein VFA27_05935 [Vicinamibacterales bacterium]|nr:hypothetical protein [Vicinamibacterales bacterium]
MLSWTPPRVALLGALLLGCAAPAVAADGWDMSLTGGFVASGLTDPVYALGTVTGRPTRVIVRETDQESSAALGVAMFAEIFHDRVKWLAPLAVGLGLRSDARAQVYMGSALRLGSHASVTTGVAIGPVATLPAGLSEGNSVADTNQLTNLGTRTKASWFAGVTYTFATLK